MPWPPPPVRLFPSFLQALFLWIVSVINTSLGKGVDSLPFIGVLDIFGESPSSAAGRPGATAGRPLCLREDGFEIFGRHCSVSPFISSSTFSSLCSIRALSNDF